MDTELIGKVSGLLVILSAVPYAIRTYQKKITPNIVSWGLWSLIGLALLLSYFSSGATDNVWPAVFGFISPLSITILAVWKRGKWEGLNTAERFCLVFGIAALIMWFLMKEERLLVQYALYVAILADLCAAVPTILFVFRNPMEDRPFAWAVYAVGYGLGIFAIEHHTFSNYILPLYMFIGAMCIALPLAYYRYKRNVPLKEWV